MGVDQYYLANFTSFMFYAYLIVLYLIYYFSFDEKRSLICMPLFQLSFNYSRKPKDFVCKVLKFENKYRSKVLLHQKLICQCLCCSTQEIACICEGCSVDLYGFLHFFCCRKVDQLTYDLRHLKTGFNNYKHRKMMKVT